MFGPSAVDASALLETLRQEGEVIKIGSEIEVAEQRWKRCEPNEQPFDLSCLTYRSIPDHRSFPVCAVPAFWLIHLSNARGATMNVLVQVKCGGS